MPPAQPAADWDSSFALPWWQDAAKYRVGALSSGTRNIRIKNVLTDSESTLQVGQAAPSACCSSSSCSRGGGQLRSCYRCSSPMRINSVCRSCQTALHCLLSADPTSHGPQPSDAPAQPCAASRSVWEAQIFSFRRCPARRPWPTFGSATWTSTAMPAATTGWHCAKTRISRFVQLRCGSLRAHLEYA